MHKKEYNDDARNPNINQPWKNLEALQGLMSYSIHGSPHMKSNQQQQIHVKSPPDFLSNMLRWLPSLLFQYLVAQEYIYATRNISIEQNYDRQSDLTSYYKPDKKYHPSSAH